MIKAWWLNIILQLKQWRNKLPNKSEPLPPNLRKVKVLFDLAPGAEARLVEMIKEYNEVVPGANVRSIQDLVLCACGFLEQVVARVRAGDSIASITIHHKGCKLIEVKSGRIGVQPDKFFVHSRPK